MRGKSGNSPFLPGGLDDIVKAGGVRGEVSSSGIGNTTERHKNWLTVAPGLSRGLRLPKNVERDGEIVEDLNVHDDVLSSETLDLSQLATVCYLFTVENLKNGLTHASFPFVVFFFGTSSQVQLLTRPDDKKKYLLQMARSMTFSHHRSVVVSLTFSSHIVC